MPEFERSYEPAGSGGAGAPPGQVAERQQRAPPTISLPQGGGALQSIGESFQVSPATGTGSLTVPIAMSPGRAGFGPGLALSYDSGAGNSPYGLGWTIGLPSISRKAQKGLPRYEDERESDTFVLSGAEDLVPVLVEQGDGAWAREVIDDPAYAVHKRDRYTVYRYRPRIEGLFARIERWVRCSDGDTHWRTITHDNRTTFYGETSSARITHPDDSHRVFEWLIERSHDDKGHALVYEYSPEDAAGVSRRLPQEKNRLRTGHALTQKYLKRVRYGNALPYLIHLNHDGQRRFDEGAWTRDNQWHFELIFDYGEHAEENPAPDEARAWPVRPDPFSMYRAGFEIRTYRQCRRILMFHHFDELGDEPYLVRSTELTFDENSIASQLRQVTHWSHQSGQKPASSPPVRFGYAQAEVDDTVHTITNEEIHSIPDGHRHRWLDLEGEGLSGILSQYDDAWFYQRNHGDGHFGPTELVASMPSVATASHPRQQLTDLNGDGQLDLVCLAPALSGYYELGGANEWDPFVAFEHLPNVNWDDPNLRHIDLTGDGHPDLLITEDQCLCWHLGEAEDGYGPAERVAKALDEEKGPALVFADGTQSIYLADMSGDGLTDLVRIRNGEICYWPNTGYATFGAKVTMDDAPRFDGPDLFDQRRIRLGDIDGTGTADVLYLGAETLYYWHNQAGNGWGKAHALAHFPRVDNLASVQVMDLLGTGTACIVWTTPLPGDSAAPLRYIPLMSAGKPYLLIEVDNSLGAVTHTEYVPSTKFYLQDRLAGRPWLTKLPFPVHVVEKVTVTDKWRDTSFGTTYSYHHGYFDGVEREFRGFGRVDQVDVESFGEFAAGNTGSPYLADDRTLYQPPVKTVTWFHTGAALDGERILSGYWEEYFPNWLEALDPAVSHVLGTFLENALPEPDLQPHDLSGEEWCEALRACKGMELRQEVYELDVDALDEGEERPVKLFSTAYHNCHIRRLQPQDTNPHAVFLVTESEAISYHYELDLRPGSSPTGTLTPDPRIAHTLNLRVDDYGNVLQSVAVVYPRLGRHEDATLPPGAEALIEQVQGEMHLAYTETRYTNDVNEHGQYRLRVPCEVLSYELTGISPQDDSDRGTPDPRDNRYFTLDELRRFRLSPEYQADGDPVPEIAYHAWPNRSTPQKRLVEHVRMLFFTDNLTEPLPFGTLNHLGLPYETYTLALTDELLTAVLGSKLTEDVLSHLGDETLSGYLSGADLTARFRGLDTIGQFWVRSGIAGFAADAADNFYLPERYTDPFGATTTLQYDPRDLYLESSTDSLGNTVTVTRFDFRVLAPRELRDINDNLSEVVFDVRGMPVAMALKGKGAEGDSLDDFTDSLVNPALGTRIGFFGDTFSEPQARDLLSGATARHIYDFGEEQVSDGTITYGHRPANAAGITRERHVAQLEPGAESLLQVAFEYSDGGGNVLVKKIQAELGTPGGSLRWIASGKTILNNKGKPVKQYEPYFTENHTFAEPVAIGITPIMYYDAVGRLVRTELPDGSYSRVEFSPWHVTSNDANDTVLEPGNAWHERLSGADASDAERRAARIAQKHADTPVTVLLDSLGREVISVVHNRKPEVTAEWTNVPLLDRPWRDEKYLTFTKLDAEGKPLWIRDARGNRVMQYITPPVPNDQATDPTSGFVPCYDISGSLLFQHSMDAGDRWMISDAAGQPFYAWDANERDGSTVLEKRAYHTTYDALRRPVAQQLKIDGGEWQTVERFVYGEPPRDAPDPEAADHEAKRLNLRGQMHQHYDPSGLTTSEHLDFKGNLLETTRQLASAYEAPVIDWTGGSPTSGLGPETLTFAQSTEYDALNRTVRQENWHLAGRDAATYTPHYNQRGLLASETVSVRGTVVGAIYAIHYNAKGQRTRLHLGNGAVTRYDYDPQTFRLSQLRTARPRYDPPFPEHRSGLVDDNVLQQLTYTYDPVGNITEVTDDAYEPVFFRNQRVEPRSRYTCDAFYRLIEAEGREQYNAMDAQPQKPPDAPQVSFPVESHDPNGLRIYTQRYLYDSVGNIMQMRHIADRGSWTRNYDYADDSNRLLRTWTGDDEINAVQYDYDSHGSMLNLNRTPDEYRLRWDQRDMIHNVNLGGGGQVWYNYDSVKQRTRKRIERNGSRVEERLYLGGMELYRCWDGSSLVEEIETHHLFADDQRVLIVEDVLSTDNALLPTGTLVRYQYSNHLGSVGLELNADAKIISYEEFHPYGTTSYQARNVGVRSTAKRYRYTGMERDDETGLTYHTARYYAPWLGRWGSVDPIGSVGGLNSFLYAENNPNRYLDPKGLQPIKSAVDRRTVDIVIPPQPNHGDLDFALLSRDVYRENQGNDLGVWRRVNRGELTALGLSNSTFRNDESGFQSVLYVREDQEQTSYTLAFAGTEFEVADILTDAASGAGVGSTQYQEALALAGNVSEAIPEGDSLFLTGHSMGGGLAAAAAVVHNIEAITFNAQGVNPDTLADYYRFQGGHSLEDARAFAGEDLAPRNAERYITSYFNQYDPLSLLQGGETNVLRQYLPERVLDFDTSRITAAQGRRIMLPHSAPAVRMPNVLRVLDDSIESGFTRVFANIALTTVQPVFDPHSIDLGISLMRNRYLQMTISRRDSGGLRIGIQ